MQVLKNKIKHKQMKQEFEASRLQIYNKQV